MTDGERLVWATSFAHAIARGEDAVVAARGAALVVAQLREALMRRTPDGNFAIWGLDERGFLDEIVTAP